MAQIDICFTVTSWWGESCCLSLCFPTGLAYCVALSAVFEFRLFGGVFTLRKPWLGGVANFGWKPKLHNSRNFISQRSTYHATQSFITPGEPQFPQLFCPCMVQLLARIISLRRVWEANPGRLHDSADTLPLRHSANVTRLGPIPYFPDMSEWTSGLIISGEVWFFPDINHGSSGGDFENYTEPTRPQHMFFIVFNVILIIKTLLTLIINKIHHCQSNTTDPNIGAHFVSTKMAPPFWIAR